VPDNFPSPNENDDLLSRASILIRSRNWIVESQLTTKSALDHAFSILNIAFYVCVRSDCDERTDGPKWREFQKALGQGGDKWNPFTSLPRERIDIGESQTCRYDARCDTRYNVIGMGIRRLRARTVMRMHACACARGESRERNARNERKLFSRDYLSTRAIGEISFPRACKINRRLTVHAALNIIVMWLHREARRENGRLVSLRVARTFSPFPSFLFLFLRPRQMNLAVRATFVLAH